MRHYILLILACLSTLNISAYNGRVTDVKNNPVIGATVSVMGSAVSLSAQDITLIEPALMECEYQARVVTDTLDRGHSFKELHTDQSARMSQIFDFLPPTTAITNIPGRNYEFEETDYH